MGRPEYTAVFKYQSRGRSEEMPELRLPQCTVWCQITHQRTDFLKYTSPYLKVHVHIDNKTIPCCFIFIYCIYCIYTVNDYEGIKALCI